MDTIRYNGKDYPSIDSFCTAFNMNPTAVRICLDDGLPIETLFDKANKRNSAVYYNGVFYPSVAKFCKDFGLRYSTAVKQFADGTLSTAEIIEQQSAINQKARAFAVCHYQGQTFDSLAEAADLLNFQASYLYALRKKKNLTSDEAIAYAVEHKTGAGNGQRTPCVIDGKQYGTKGEALQAYGISRATVTSNMRRFNLTFEEAFAQTVRAKTRFPQEHPLASEAVFSPIDGISITNKYHDELFHILQSKGYTPQYSIADPYPIIRFQDNLGSANEKKDIDIIFSNTTTELYIEELDFCTDKSIDLYKSLNRFNAQLMGAKFWLNEDTGIVSANWNRKSGKNAAHDAPHTYRMIAAFLGTCESFLNKEEAAD